MMNGKVVFVKTNGTITMLEPPSQDAGELVSVVAQNIRRLRERGGMTLGQLATAAGVGKSTLSQLESGQCNPSIETLWGVGRALGVPFGQLLEPGRPEVHVVRAGEGHVVKAEGARYQARLVLARTRRGASELYMLESEPGPPRVAEPHIAGVVEHMLMIAGEMRVGPLEAPVTLGPGDLVSFDGDEPHVYETTAPGTRALLWMDYA